MTAKIFTPETEYPSYPDDSFRTSLFLAGTIEMGNSVDWQSMMIEKLKDSSVGIFNPRRVVSTSDQKEIERQINWELKSINRCKIIFMYLAEGSISPISLYELGLLQGGKADGKLVIVYCDPGYTRKNNVIVTTNNDYFHHPSIRMFTDFDKAFKSLRDEIERRSLRF